MDLTSRFCVNSLKRAVHLKRGSILVAITPVYAFVHRVKQKQNQKEAERSILKQKRSLLHNGGGFGCTRSDFCFRSRKKTDQIWHQKKIRSPEAKTNHSRLKSLASQFKHHLVVSCSIKRPDMMTKIQINALNLYCFVSNVLKESKMFCK